MAGILGIDLDTAELRLVELNQTASGYQLHAALALPTGILDAAALGAQLKERLASVGFKGATAVIALSHDAMTCREVRHPNIPSEELPAIVQFQVMKESSLPPDDAIVDYVPLSQPLSTGEHRSLAFVVRKSRVQFCEKMCESAGLKLLAVVPRAVALLAGVSKNKSDSGAAVGYACSNSFFVVHKGELIFNRSMGTPNDQEELVSELRRSIAGYENQAHMPALDLVNLAVAELPDVAQKQIDKFQVPVRLFDPYQGIVGAERLVGHVDYAVACGAAQTTKAFKKPPVEFLSPKKVFVKPNRTRSYAIIGGVAVAALALLTFGIYWMMTSTADAEIAELQKSIQNKQKLEKIYVVDNEVEKRFDAIKSWKDQEIYVLEEIYDLIESFPDVPGVQIIKAEWKSTATTGPTPMAVPGKTTIPAASSFGKTTPVKPVARLIVKATAEEEEQLNALQTALKNSKHWNWVKFEVVTQEKNTKIFELDVLPLKPEDYRATIALGNNISATGDGTGSNRRGPNRGFRPTTGGRP